MATDKAKEMDADNIRHDIQSLKKDLETLSKHVGSDSYLKFEELKNRTKENIAHFQDYSRENMKAVENDIKAHPMKSIMLAFAGGLLTSLLFWRK